MQDLKTFFEYELDGKKVVFHNTAMLEVQLGWGQGKYKTIGQYNAAEFSRAVMQYNGYNVNHGFKKRLICRTLNNPILARKLTY